MTTIDYKALAERINEYADGLDEIRQAIGDRTVITDDPAADLRTVVSLLEGMAEEKSVAWVEVADAYEGPYSFHGQELLPTGRHSLFMHPAPQPQIDRLTRERDEARAEVKSLRAENHNLNWALGTEGYEQMATPEEQAEHEEAVRRTDEVLDRMAAAKAEHDAKYRDAERYRWLRQMIYDDRIVAADRMLHGEALDSAIDAALAQIEQEKANGSR